MSQEYKLANAPTDCIQSVKFGQTNDHNLLVASWDNTVRLYDVEANKLRVQYTHDDPVLDASFHGNSACWSAGADNKVKKFDFNSQTESVVGFHLKPVKCVTFNEDFNLMATGSWDHHLKLWDPRLADSSQKALVGNHELCDKIFAITSSGHRLVLGLAHRTEVIFDIRNMTQAVKEANLKYQIRNLAAFPDQRGYVVTSIEGRVSVEYFDPSPDVQKLRYAFKCHRSKDQNTGEDIVFPVHAISFHNKYNTFATGGGDGLVSVWDASSKKRIVQFHRYPNSISSLSFSHDGSLLAIACSYQDTKDPHLCLREIPKDSIFIRPIQEHEVKNKK